MLLAWGNHPILLSSAADPLKLHIRSYLTGTASCPRPFHNQHYSCQFTTFVSKLSHCQAVSMSQQHTHLLHEKNLEPKLSFLLFQVRCSYWPILHDVHIHFLNHDLLHLILKPCFNAVLPFTCQGYPLSFTVVPPSVVLPKTCLLPHPVLSWYHASNTFLTAHSLVTISKSKPRLCGICQQDSSISVRTSAQLSKYAALSRSDTATQE